MFRDLRDKDGPPQPLRHPLVVPLTVTASHSPGGHSVRAQCTLSTVGDGCPSVSQTWFKAPYLTCLSPLPARCAPRQLLGLPGASGLCCGPPLCSYPPHSCHLRTCAQGLVTQQHYLQCSQGLCHLCEYLVCVGAEGVSLLRIT